MNSSQREVNYQPINICKYTTSSINVPHMNVMKLYEILYFQIGAKERML